ncbi:hypothetical protein RSOLAG1IB_05158 [Rhizoctonia solani AG-1 IB]|uniref:Uncharacterized protein n=1 Tax=Thanatephorus cucumeris (strain AG1-IB / isolate 7/3/14) TaxID=1108050 RepID=A0A0B7G3Q4_THACB|nr:hypothetical protein RSOLAG1IB_05158 [Rhizoctonia solani AG-1 IB]
MLPNHLQYQATMLGDIHAASNVFRTSLEQYAGACSVLCNNIPDKTSVHNAKDFLDLISNELESIKVYKEKLVQAESAMKRAKNNWMNAPINGLPAKILIRIFHLILAQQPCPLRVGGYWNPKNPARLPQYPDILSHVCSRWRRIALASPSLWSHIDIALSSPLSAAFHRRAESYATRAHRVALEIHLVDPGCYPKTPRVCECGEAHECDEDSENEFEWYEWVKDNNPQVFSFLSSPGVHSIKSIGLKTHKGHHDIHTRALSYCLSNCLPGDLNELLISMNDHSWGSFEPCQDPQPQMSDLYYYQLSLTAQQLERICLSVCTLRMTGAYINWESALYRGLTDFRLVGLTSIKDYELVRILQSSPKLRVIQCRFDVIVSDQSATLPIPVTLGDLEILDLSFMRGAIAETCLGYINPGSKPLQLLVDCSPTSSIFEEFFARSNVQELHVKPGYLGWGKFPALPDQFYLPSQLRVLVMAKWGWNQGRQNFRWDKTSPEVMKAPCPVQLEALTITDCCYANFDQFRQMVRYFLPQQLIVRDCTTFIRGEKQKISSSLDAEFGGNVSQICPSTRYLITKGISLYD